jgi:hypothetical protein
MPDGRIAFRVETTCENDDAVKDKVRQYLTTQSGAVLRCSINDSIRRLTQNEPASKAAIVGTIQLRRNRSRMDELEKHQEVALVAVSLYTATLITCFSIAFALL